MSIEMIFNPCYMVWKQYLSIKKKYFADFLGGLVGWDSVVPMQGRPGFDRWSGNWFPYAAAKTQGSQINIFF